MLVSCHGRQLPSAPPDAGRRRRIAGGRAAAQRRQPDAPPPRWLATCTLALPLAACGEGPGASGTTALVVLFTVALLAALVAAAYALGASRARLLSESALREARAEATLQTELLDGASWHTDAEHRPVAWRFAPEEPAKGPGLLGHADLLAHLQSRSAFAELRVDLPVALEGSRGWVLRGMPRYDRLGNFAGFVGSARPTLATDLGTALAAAISPLLELHKGPALLALDTGSGWTLDRCNAAAAQRWPQMLPGAALPGALGALPEAAAAAFAASSALPAAVDAAPWSIQPLGALPPGFRGLVLLHLDGTPDPVGPDKAAAQAAARAESDSFSFTVSHDLRAPIRVVEGFTRIVKEDYGRLLDRVGNDHLDRVLGAAARMNLMIDALLTLARLSSQPLAHQPVNLSQLASYVVDDLRRAAPEREADIDIEPELVTHGDPTLLRLVLENLLGNAWKYSARSPRTRIGFASLVHDGRLAYMVRDNGAGFDMRSSERLFGLFQRLHSASEFAGHGVGLASVQRIVRRHGGDIWAEAEPGRGATFYFTLAG